MTTPSTSEAFLGLVRQSGVVEADNFEGFLREFAGSAPLPGAPKELASLLIDRGLLTHFQAEQLLQGKWRGFSIGKYKLLERLGAGGMGIVYLCEHKFLRRRVAVKFLPLTLADDPLFL